MSAGGRHPNVTNLSEVQTRTDSKGTRFAYASKWLGNALGSKGIGCSWYEVPPGKTAFPFHWHSANAEAVFVLEGEGTARIGEARVPIRAGDYIDFPPGPEHSHQLLNTGQGPLRYLGISTMQYPEVVGYPDSKKVGVRTPGPDFAHPWIRELYRAGSGVDYYDGEPTD